ncbi:hypothetical protein AN958_03945 [Leucoagaricus sp. SymC.cos]|nr:hypothetical protein AN958_03945 [Leucoagaricus sp. SymC.cos]
MCICTKASTIKPRGKIHPLLIPTKLWYSIEMDFIGLFSELKGHNYLWIMICCMTSMVHSIPVYTQMSMSGLS